MWSFIIFGVLVYFVVKWFRKNPYTPEREISTYTAPYKAATSSEKTAAIKKEKGKPAKILVMPTKVVETVSDTPEPPVPPKYYPQKSLKEQHAPFLCDGTACNFYQKCHEGEQSFCNAVIKKAVKEWPNYCAKIHNKNVVIPPFKGQYTVKMPSKSRHIDFVIYGYGGKPLAIELDGYTSHIKNAKPEKQSDDAIRQNEITRAGYLLLHIPYHDFRTNSNACKKQILETMASQCNDGVNTDELHFLRYALIYGVKNGDAEILKRKGALYSEHRAQWYIQNPDIETEAKFFNWQLVYLKRCIYEGCEANAILSEGSNDTYYCESCDKYFNQKQEVEAYHKTYG